MTLRNHRLITFGIALALAAIVTGPASAFNPQPEPPGSVAIGLTESQTARISVVNDTDRVSGIIPCVCPVVLTLVDQNGNVLDTAFLDVDPGAIGSATFDVPLARGETTMVRGLVEFSGPEGERLVCNGATRSGLEIVGIDSGRTEIAVPITTTYLAARE